ncbi:MAG TPA: metal-sensing transcriptional repressor [Candidatus Binatus sp.]|nr:metal-sensing transcriptional repressor [Candidatus Binatus sp.]HKN14845.1 metal-sensing transcriptional repressor [Candidatus Binatus sp.]
MGNRQKLNERFAAGPPVQPSRGEPELHRSHKDVVARMRRAEGHLRNVISMIEGGRGCAEIAQQMHAVIRALECAKGVLIHDHIDHCLEAAVGPIAGREKEIIDEFKEITRYL